MADPVQGSAASGTGADHDCGDAGECPIHDSLMRPITDDFYRSPSGEWVYRWSDERLVLKEGPTNGE